MEELNQVIREMAVKIARIENSLEYHRESLDRIEEAVSESAKEIEPIKKQVHQHGVILKAFGGLLGIIGTYFTSKVLGLFS